jgi:protein TonB
MVLSLFLLNDNKFSTPKTYETLIDIVASTPVVKTAVPSTIKHVTTSSSEKQLKKIQSLETIDTVSATKEIQNTNANSDTNSLTSGQIASIEDVYITNIKRTLNKNKFYPITAKKLKQTGVVKVQFEINEHGHIINKSIIESSIHQSLNQAVTELLDRVRSFEPIPKEFGKKNWIFVLPVEFKI